MKIDKRLLYEDIIKKDNTQYTIPVYQRNYTWEKENCEVLYEDIINSIKNERPHFLGSLIYFVSKRDDIKQCFIIDGQQRLTTVMVLLKAMYDLIEDPEDITKQKIIHNFYNEFCDDRYRLRLKNTENDNTELEKILMGENSDLDSTSKIVINYNYFKSKIKKSIEKDNFTFKDLLNGISNLEIVEIILEEKDSPQKIYESINSTGVKLTTSDLIRNFLLMGIMDAGLQKEIYIKYWVTLENLIGRENIEKFFYNFLILKDTRYIEETKVYNNFKEYYLKKNISSIDNVEEIFKEILKYAKYYKLLVCNNSKEYSEETNKLCNIFNILKHKTIYPFLLKVCEDFDDIRKKYNDEILLNEEERNLIEIKEKEFNKILKLFGNYALRRNICNVYSSSLRRFYSSLYAHIFEKNKNNYNNYYKAVEAYMCTLKTENKMPSDNSFIDGLYYDNMYANSKSKILIYFFDLIENGSETKERVDLSNLTIEHIMPETLSIKWKEELGENYQQIFDKYLHTLGNLSITGYNSEYSNDLFSEKKKLFNSMIEKGISKIIKLNLELLEGKEECVDQWGETEIKKRADRLSKIILSKFPYPTDIDMSLEFEKYYEIYIGDEEDEVGEYINNSSYKLYGFMYDGIKYSFSSYKSIYREIIKMLYKKARIFSDLYGAWHAQHTISLHKSLKLSYFSAKYYFLLRKKMRDKRKYVQDYLYTLIMVGLLFLNG